MTRIFRSFRTALRAAGRAAVGVSLLISTAIADTGLESRVRVYVYRPVVFADRFISAGLPSDIASLGDRLWYVRLDDYARLLAGPDGLRTFLKKSGARGLDFSSSPLLSNTDLERLFPTRASASRLYLLKLNGTRVDDRAMGTAALFDDLQVLELNDRISDAGLRRLERLRGLRVLSVAGRGVTDASAPVFAQLTRLRRLRLAGTATGDDTVKAVRALPLREIALGTGATDEALKTLATLKGLEQIDAQSARVSEPGLAALSNLPMLHTLFLGASFKDADASALAALKRLRRLDLSGAGVTDPGVTILSMVAGLEELALSGTSVTDASLAALGRMPKLRYLEISDTRVTPAGLREVKGFPALQVISISAKERLTTEDVRTLARLPKLHRILVNGRPLSTQALKQLRDGKKRSRLLDWMLPQAHAADDLEGALEMASVPGKPATFSGFQGLKRIHEAESSLDEMVPAVSNPKADSFDASESNFLGEFTVGAAPSGR
jgi:hypothetical protein